MLFARKNWLKFLLDVILPLRFVVPKDLTHTCTFKQIHSAKARVVVRNSETGLNFVGSLVVPVLQFIKVVSSSC